MSWLDIAEGIAVLATLAGFFLLGYAIVTDTPDIHDDDDPYE